MRRASIYVMLLLLGANLYSCGKENFGEADTIGKGDASYSENNNTTPGEDGEIEEEKKEFIDTTDWSDYDDSTYLIGFGGVCEEVETVRASFSFILGDDQTAAQTRWESGDEVLVYVPSKNQYGTYAYDATRKQFRPINVNNVVANKNEVAYAYYPASLYSNPASGKVSFNLQNGISATNDLGDKLPMSAKILSTSNDPHPTATFKNLCSILRVQLTGCETITSVTLSNDNIPLVGGGTVAWNGDAPTLTTSGGAKSVTIDLGANGILLDESSANEYYFILPSSGTSMSGMKISTTFTQKLGTTTYTPTLTRSRNGALAYGRSQVVKVALRAGFFSGGDGTEDNPYQIKTANDLKYLIAAAQGTEDEYGYNASSANKCNYFRSQVYYKQTADIDCNKEALGIIGNNDYNFFAHYDGNNQSISNATVTSGSIQVGLFGVVNGGSIKNLTLSNISVKSTATDNISNTGCLLGLLSGGGQVQNCKVKSSTITGLKCGGIIGYIRNGNIDNCQAHGISVTSNGSYFSEEEERHGYCGGIVGGSKKGIIQNCSCYGANNDGTGTPSTITGMGATGGISGYAGLENSEPGTSAIIECYVSNTSITSSGENVGGIVGKCYVNSSIKGFTSAQQDYPCVKGSGEQSGGQGPVTITGVSRVGGIVGHLVGNITGTKYSNTGYIPLAKYAIVKATKGYAGGIVGYNNGTCTTCYIMHSNVSNGAAEADGKHGVGGICGIQLTNGKLVDCIYRYCTIYSSNSGQTAYYDFVGGLVGKMEGGSIDNSTTTATCGKSSTIKGKAYVGGLVGKMDSGTIQGRNNKAVLIEDNTMVTASGSYASMGIGYCEGGTIKNITINQADGSTNSTVSGLASVGGVVGYVAKTTKIDNCTINKLTLNGTTRIGGIVGSAMGTDASNRTTVENCVTENLTASATDSTRVGGIAGYVEDHVRLISCISNNLNLNASKQEIGGIAGTVNGVSQIKLCVNNKLSNNAVNFVGGIVGALYKGEIYQCINNSSVSGGTNIGGIAGRLNSGDIYQCYSSDHKSATITGLYNVGGIAGSVIPSGENGNFRALILCSSSRSDVTATSTADDKNYNGAVGGLVGRLDGGNDGVGHASLANCVAWEAVIKNTKSTARNIGGIVGQVTGSKATVQNCYAQTNSNGLILGTGESSVWIGGVYGYVHNGGSVLDCYYRCDQTGRRENDNSTVTNCTQISHAAKNGKEKVTVTLANGTKITDYLWEILSAMSGKKSFRIHYPDNNETKNLLGWTYYIPGSDNTYKFSLPTLISDLGTDYYLR